MADEAGVIQEKRQRLQKLEEELKSHLSKPKCKWPLSIMMEIHEVADAIKEIVAKDFYASMQWPNEKFAHPKAFYAGPHNIANVFQRTETWLENQGWSKYTTTYTYADAWDRLPLTAAFYVPDTLRPEDKAPVMWFWHGGGFCTGANDHIPWFSSASMKFARQNKAIVIAPNYPLGPEANYQDIVSAIKDFLHFYKNDECFEPNFNTWTDWLVNQCSSKKGIKNITIDKDRIILDGESAGGNAAVTALFLNADKASGTQIPIKAALLRYPMLAHYERTFRTTGEAYMGETFQTIDPLLKQVKLILAERDNLEQQGLLPTRAASAAPENMAAAFLLSMTQTWEASFKRQHKGQTLDDPFDNKDCIERARDSIDIIDPSCLPNLFIYHGNKDVNCPHTDTEEFVHVLKEKYPARYNEDTVVLKTVDKLSGKTALDGKPVIGVAHGFDHDLDVENEGFLREVYRGVERCWVG